MTNPAGTGATPVRWARVLRISLTILILALGGSALNHAWQEVGRSPVIWHFDWPWVVASLLVTWLMYGLLIAGWRLIIISWGERIGWYDSTRIWTLSSLAALIPGRVWAIAGMAVMAERAGVSAAAATGSAIVMQLLSISTGATIGLALLGQEAAAYLPGGAVGAWLLSGASLMASALLASSQVMARLSRLLRRPAPLPPLSSKALILGIVINTLAWAGYGAAFRWLAAGTLPESIPSWTLATGAYALAYLTGYLAVLFPGGIGAREAALIFFLGPLGAVPAAALALASRVVTLLNQFGAAAPFLSNRSSDRDRT